MERVTYHNADNGFAVLKLQTRGKRDLITLVGHAASIMEGEWITASGSWVSDRTHGIQFKAQTRPCDNPYRRPWHYGVTSGGHAAATIEHDPHATELLARSISPMGLSSGTSPRQEAEGSLEDVVTLE